MEGFLDQLESYDGDDFDTYFDELMTTNSEDPGSISNPNGYLFQSGNMVPEFEDATKALEIGQFSDIVETNYGYHIIYRIPLNYDVVPSAPGSTDSLRYSTAYSMYDATVQDVWLNSLDVTYSDAYDALDFKQDIRRWVRCTTKNRQQPLPVFCWLSSITWCLIRFAVFKSGFYKPEKQRVRFRGSAFKFRMKLHADKPRVLVILNDLHKIAVGRQPDKIEAAFL